MSTRKLPLLMAELAADYDEAAQSRHNYAHPGTSRFPSPYTSCGVAQCREAGERVRELEAHAAGCPICGKFVIDHATGDGSTDGCPLNRTGMLWALRIKNETPAVNIRVVDIKPDPGLAGRMP